MRIVLIVTSPVGMLGSMSRYAELAQIGLQRLPGVEVSRLDLALPERHLKRVPPSVRNWIHHGWIMLKARYCLKRSEATVYHILDGSHAYLSRWLPDRPAVATSHDMIPFLQLRGYLGEKAMPSLAGRHIILRSVSNLCTMNHIVADSGHTREDLVRHANISADMISVVHPAVSPHMLEAGCVREGRSSDPYVLHLGHNGFFKNRSGVLRIYAHLKRLTAIRLVMAGAAPDEELLSTVRELGLANDVRFVVNPDEARMLELYRGAELFVFPSLYEGFGWPPLEAMSQGCPVVCSSSASLPEVVGDAGRVCDVEDEDRMAEICAEIVCDVTLRARLSRAGRKHALEHSVDNMSKGLYGAYTAALDT